MWKSWTTIGVAGMLAGAPVPAQAQPAAPMMYCLPGSAFACFAMDFAVSGSTATFWLQNLQGSATPDPTVWNIPGFQVYRQNPAVGGLPTEQMQFATTGAGSGTLVGAVNANPEAEPPLMQEDSYVEEETTLFQTRRYYQVDATTGGLYGCSLPPGIGPGDLWIAQTCPTLGYDGWFRMTFGVGIHLDPVGGSGAMRPLAPADVAFGVGGCMIRGANSGVAAGALGPDCTVSPYQFAVVPEPGTLALLGGGLGVLGLAGWRRRRAAPR